MRNGPWSEHAEIRDAIRSRKLPVSIGGKKPVAVESTGNVARFLYVIPDRDPLPFTAFPPMLHFHG